MKILGIYLPAFHQTELNDRVWGKGFVEWQNVKNAKKLYNEHYQPIIPYNDNYYDLSNKEEIRKQIKMAKDYCVDGFIFYHYWFGNGEMTLEKPAEILKKELDDKIEYCFCWANHSWITNWHDQPPILMVEQKYGDKNDWKKHIDYLIDFFKDDRYIKINNRPVIYIYNMSEINNFDEMLKLWNSELKKAGLNEIYIVEYISSKNRKLSYVNTDAVVEFEPLYTTFFDISPYKIFKRFLCKKLKKIDFQDYDYLWRKIINRKRTYHGKKIFKGCFTGWDNSARKGKSSMIVKNNTPEKFGMYLKKLINNNRKDATNDFIVINAWNEWSEGAMLEPSKKDGFAYLEQIRGIVNEERKK